VPPHRLAGVSHEAHEALLTEPLGPWRWGQRAGAIGADERVAGQYRAERHARNAPDLLIARSETVAGLPVTDPLGRDIHQRLAGCERWPGRWQRPGALSHDADEDIFEWEGATSIVARPAQVLCDNAQGFLQRSSCSSCDRVATRRADAGAAGGCALRCVLSATPKTFFLSWRRATLPVRAVSVTLLDVQGCALCCAMLCGSGEAAPGMCREQFN
jgi:hypothetical protein